MRRLPSLVLVVCGLLVVGDAGHAAPPGWEVLSSSDRLLHIRITTGEPTLETISVEGRSYLRLDLPGWFDSGEAGLPLAPSRGSATSWFTRRSNA